MNEILLSKQWISDTNVHLTNQPDFVFEKYRVIPEYLQKKYIKLLNKHNFIIINNKEYMNIYGKPIEKRYAIAFRFVCSMPVSAERLDELLGVFKTDDGATIVAIERQTVLPPEYNHMKFHRVVLTLETDILPKNIHIFDLYDILSFPGDSVPVD